jgi:hypothetical protein
VIGRAVTCATVGGPFGSLVGSVLSIVDSILLVSFSASCAFKAADVRPSELEGESQVLKEISTRPCEVA